MSSKLMARLGVIAGIVTSVKQGWNRPEEQMVQDASENLTKTFPLLEENEFNFSAVSECSVALQRGFYFSLRMPDWARDFKEQTQKILAHSFELPRIHSKGGKDSKLSKYYGEDRSERYGVIFLETSTGHFFEDIPREMPVPADQTRSNRPVRLPKIKDDLTCGKKVSS
ncbi:uncharacterized protein LOC108022507 [Drosophila biarmipes]|uniref:uncharacterized protein LOC108022507 n=1 Tax=Drosophila biarmipes TaxID=125945 RepID=UPI0007E6BFFB|nr:uncharacterized protein LOC108022507 [Drosophila biarmipes]